ncbi:isoprenylcysteine carboxylmethyltransferase family protein [Aliigemmobacter aestuarii]|uniref:Isoprenylcysteine carboxylmethyltransferase family protein n=1 Tax=Aliigemmobacter aestuarii TaxID=1445661 RepID=A0A4S3MKS1_9RHOB|nr:methyltransferase [Gemmobacter aestuarii]THD82794.1 isoprenylcysteine carboxylmethyltransferase family protein [Gemmobacter aestuarii]
MKFLDWPPVWTGGFVALTWALDQLLPWGMFGPAGRTIGAVLVAVGLFLMAGAAAQMVLARTTFIPRRDPSALVTGGLFRFSRNPIYLGDVLVLAGAVLWWDVPLAAMLVLLLILVIQHRFILGEEARLRAAFPQDYARWSARTRRWL